MNKIHLRIIYTILSAIVACLGFLLQSCTAGFVIGHSNKQTQETNVPIKADSSKVQPSLQIFK